MVGKDDSGSKRVEGWWEWSGDIGDVAALCPERGLYLKGVVMIEVAVTVSGGGAVATRPLQEAVRQWAAPTKLGRVRLLHSSLGEAKLDVEVVGGYTAVLAVVARLDGKRAQVGQKKLRVRASPAPTTTASSVRSSGGEKPDTVHLSHLPTSWFASKADPSRPSQRAVQKIFEKFGEISAIDIPVLDPYRERIEACSGRLPTFDGSSLAEKDVGIGKAHITLFDAYVRFKNHSGFVRTMDAFKGSKLLLKDGSRAYIANIEVDPDKTKHMSESSIRRRMVEREKLIVEDAEREEKKKKLKEEEEKLIENARKKKEAEMNAKEERSRQREERRKAKALRRLQKKEEFTNAAVNKKIAEEERLLLIAQTKLESIRLISLLLERVKGDRDRNSEEVTNKPFEKPIKVEEIKIEKHSGTLDESRKNKEVKNKNGQSIKKNSVERGKKAKKEDSYILTDRSGENRRDYKKPTFLGKSKWHDNDDSERWRGRQRRSKERTNWRRKKSASTSEDWIPLTHYTQQLYYKYFQSISGVSGGESHCRRSLSWSRSPPLLPPSASPRSRSSTPLYRHQRDHSSQHYRDRSSQYRYDRSDQFNHVTNDHWLRESRGRTPENVRPKSISKRPADKSLPQSPRRKKKKK